jgi:hypothetical protein
MLTSCIIFLLQFSPLFIWIYKLIFLTYTSVSVYIYSNSFLIFAFCFLLTYPFPSTFLCFCFASLLLFHAMYISIFLHYFFNGNPLRELILTRAVSDELHYTYRQVLLGTPLFLHTAHTHRHTHTHTYYGHSSALFRPL